MLLRISSETCLVIEKKLDKYTGKLLPYEQTLYSQTLENRQKENHPDNRIKLATKKKRIAQDVKLCD